MNAPQDTIEPGDIVEYGTSTYVVVDVADYREDDDDETAIFGVLRVNLPEGHPNRPLNPDGSDVIQDAPRLNQLTKVGHI